MIDGLGRNKNDPAEQIPSLNKLPVSHCGVELAKLMSAHNDDDVAMPTAEGL